MSEGVSAVEWSRVGEGEELGQKKGLVSCDFESYVKQVLSLLFAITAPFTWLSPSSPNIHMVPSIIRIYVPSHIGT